jgi:hypothetical protein
MELVAERAPIREASTRAFREGAGTGSKREIVIIEAGWGSSGYYSETVLERDIPRIFPVGTHMYLDHPTVKEERERPERSVRDLVGTIVEAPRMAGIASVAVCEVFEHWVPVIDALAESIGLSIRAFGVSEEGSAGGKDGPIIQTLTEGLSIDYVTMAGAGGKIGALTEAARAKVMPLIESAREKQPDALKQEALDSELHQNLEKAGEERFASDEPYTYCYVEDIEIDDNWVVYRVRVSGEEATYQRVGFVRNTDGDVALSASSEEVEREISWVNDAEDTDDEPVIAQEVQKLLEKNRSGGPTKEDSMSDEDRKRLSELEESNRQLENENKTLKEENGKLQTRVERVEEAQKLGEAASVATKAVAKVEALAKLPKAQARAVREATSGTLPTDSEGRLDKDALEERATKKAKDEMEYLGLTSEAGKPRGVGGGNGDVPVEEAENEKDTASFEAELIAGGMSESAAKVAARGRR